MSNLVGVKVNSEEYISQCVYILDTDQDIAEMDEDLLGAYAEIAASEIKVSHVESDFETSLYERVYAAANDRSDWCFQIEPLQPLVDWFKSLSPADRDTQSRILSDFQYFTSVHMTSKKYQSKESLLEYLKEQKQALLKRELSFYQPEEFWASSWKIKVPDAFFNIAIKKCETIHC